MIIKAMQDCINYTTPVQVLQWGYHDIRLFRTVLGTLFCVSGYTGAVPDIISVELGLGNTENYAVECELSPLTYHSFECNFLTEYEIY